MKQLAPSVAAAAPTAVRLRFGILRRWAIRIAAISVAFLLWQSFNIFVSTNVHTLIEGQVYRSAQLDETQLDSMIRNRGIRTVVNLRGYNGWEAWYQAESRATGKNGVSQEDLTTSANVLPNPNEMRKLVEIFDRSEHPILIHCRRGADRTGLASGIYLLLYTDAMLGDARQVCSPRYGHFRALSTARMDEFFDRYDYYLKSGHVVHTPDIFRDWIMTKYKPGIYSADLKLPEVPKWSINRPLIFDVTAVNTSADAWKMSVGLFTGVHLRYQLMDEAGTEIYREFAGQFNRSIQPGSEVTLQVCLPPVARPGTYYLQLEMIGPHHTAFSKIGWLPAVMKFELN